MKVICLILMSVFIFSPVSYAEDSDSPIKEVRESNKLSVFDNHNNRMNRLYEVNYSDNEQNNIESITIDGLLLKCIAFGNEQLQSFYHDVTSRLHKEAESLLTRHRRKTPLGFNLQFDPGIASTNYGRIFITGVVKDSDLRYSRSRRMKLNLPHDMRCRISVATKDYWDQIERTPHEEDTTTAQ